MAKKKDEIIEEPAEDFWNPEEAFEAPVRPLQPEIEGATPKPVSGIVEPDSLAVIRARRDAHLAKSRR